VGPLDLEDGSIPPDRYVTVLRLDDKLPRPTGPAVETPAPTFALPPNLRLTPA
jgi:hypothetical protein